MAVNRNLFLKEQIPLLLAKFTFPASLGMAAIAFCNLIDLIFIGKFAGTAALAAVALALPIFMLLSALGNTIGFGGSALWSIETGARNEQKASKIFSNAILLNVIIGISLMVLGLSFLDPILSFINTPVDVYPLAKTYISIYFIASFFVVSLISLNGFIRAEGKPNTAMMAVLLVAISVIVLDSLFIAYMNLGILGAGLAFMGSHLIGLLYMVYHFVFGESDLRFSLKDIKPDLAIMAEILNVGTPSFCRQISVGIMHFVVNFSVVLYAGGMASMYLAITGISLKCMMFILMPVFGVIQGMTPIISFNYGAKEYQRARATIFLAMLFAAGIASVIWGAMIVFPEMTISIFSNDDTVINAGGHVLTVMLMAIPLVAAQTTGAGLFQALKKPIPASIFALIRQVLILVPVILTIPLFWGLQGVWWSIPIADLVAVFVTGVFVFRETVLLRSLQKSTKQVNNFHYQY